jgi:hypothetical protein
MDLNPYFVLQCCQCSGFIVQQRIKAKKWTCRRCRTAQSFMRKFATVATAKQAREALIVISTSYHENQERKVQEESEARESARIYKSSYNAAFNAAAESLGVNASDLMRGSEQSRVQTGVVGSAWAEYIEDDERLVMMPTSSSSPRVNNKRTRDIEEDVVVEVEAKQTKLLVNQLISVKKEREQSIPVVVSHPPPPPPPPLSIWDEL